MKPGCSSSPLPDFNSSAYAVASRTTICVESLDGGEAGMPWMPEPVPDDFIRVSGGSSENIIMRSMTRAIGLPCDAGTRRRRRDASFCPLCTRRVRSFSRRLRMASSRSGVTMRFTALGGTGVSSMIARIVCTSSFAENGRLPTMHQ